LYKMKVVFVLLLLVGLTWAAAKPKGKTTPKPQLNCECGKRNTGRIYGGTPTKKNEYPWMAAIEDEDKDHYCGGSVITERHILTAAHCVWGVKSN
ncbi:trypsin-like serine protease, partial [Shewanella sp. C31]|nr:trypsin-like serine protease [Shewanella electrica]